jgi:dienelactone hydrolase
MLRASLAIACLTALSAASAQPTPPSTALFAYDRRAPLDLRDSVARTTDSLVIHRVSFASPKGGRATGWLYVPTVAPRGPGGRYAGIVVLHGAPGDAAGMGFVSEPVARSGAVVLTIDAPFARRDPDTPLRFTPQDSADVVQYVVDLQRAVDVLGARPDVDPARMGAVGISYGGTMGALLAGVERRLSAYVLAVADGGPAEHFADLAGRRRPAPPGMTDAQWRAWNDAMAPVAALRFVGRAAPARLLFLWGREDTFVPPEHALALWRAAPAASRDSIWYASGHALPPASGDDHQRWLAERLGTAPPPAFAGPAAAYVGTYSGWGPMGRAPLDVRVVADARGRLAMRGPLTGPDDPDGRLTYVGRTADGDVFRFWDKQLTFVRTGARVTALHVDARMDTTPVHIVLTR